MNASKKITLATFKSFLRKNDGKLFIKEHSRFSGMTDCVMSVDDTWKPLKKIELELRPNSCEVINKLGYEGIWLVGDSRDFFSRIDDVVMEGYHIHNCVGSFSVVIQKD